MVNVFVEEELLKHFSHSPDDFPVLCRQTHRVLRGKEIVSERININENLMHYVRDTALLISVIDGFVSSELDSKSRSAFDHVVYLDKSARPVSWLVNMFWPEFAKKDSAGNVVKRPAHSYVNIDRAPWFLNVGIAVTQDGRQKENGELATYTDFVAHIGNLDQRHIAAIRALYIPDGIENDDIEGIMQMPTILTGKRILIVDEVSRTGATLDIAKHLFRLAFPDAETIEGTYFWHAEEPKLMIGSESMLTSLPVWYDPNTLTGRGIGGLNEGYFKKRYHYYLEYLKEHDGEKMDLKKLYTQYFSASVYSAPLLKEDGSVLDLQEERKTRRLFRDLKKLYEEYRAGRILFVPPLSLLRTGRYDEYIQGLGLLMIPRDADEATREKIRENPAFYLNFREKLKEM